MIRKLRNLVVVIGVLCMVIGGCGIDSIASEEILSGGEILEGLYEGNMNIVNKKMDAQDIQLLEELNSVYGSIEEEMKEQISSTTNDIIYKDYYAGAYIEGNNLIVCVTNKKEATKDNSVMYALENNNLQETGIIAKQKEISDQLLKLVQQHFEHSEKSSVLMHHLLQKGFPFRI